MTDTHALNGSEIREFISRIRSLASYMLADWKRENVAMHRDACVALIEEEERRRGFLPVVAR